MRKMTLLLPILLVLIVVGGSSFFIVDERQKAIVLQFGQIKQVKETPGLAFKMPFVQNVARYDDRILALDTNPLEVTPADDRRLIVDAFARYRIQDVVQFRQAVGEGGLRVAELRLADILTTQTREVLGSEGVTSDVILSSERSELMTRIRDQSQARAEALGLDVIDVRLQQTNLPDQNLSATFARMRAEREREAADEIARGEEAAQRVRAQADRTVTELVSEAQREAEITRGQADARANSVYAEAYNQNQEFFEFYRSLAAYERALQGSNSSMVMAPDSEFFDYLDGSNGRNGGQAQASAPASGQAPSGGQGSGGQQQSSAGGAGGASQPSGTPQAQGGSGQTATQ